MPNLQAAIDKAFALGGGTVWIPRGVTVLNEPLRLKSAVRLLGQGRHQSTLKIADGVQAEAVVITDHWEDTLTANLWNYNKGTANGGQVVFDESNGLHMGFAVENVLIDGNKRGGAKVGGLYVYGGGFRLDNIGIMDCTGHGLQTQCGRPNNSWAGDAVYRYWNMHEASISSVSISNVDCDGVLYRGPNDSYLDKVQVKMAGGTGVFIDTGPTIETGGLKIGTLHAYSTKGPTFKFRGSYITADYLYCDTPGEDGHVDQSRLREGQLRVRIKAGSHLRART